MTLKTFYPILITILALVATVSLSPVLACEQRPDQDAFRSELTEDANPQSNGMLLIGYADAGGYRVTHITYHRVVGTLQRSALSTVALAPGQMSVEVDGSLGPLLYVIIAAPLYYGTDIDSEGLPRRLWIDSEEDGLNGNETLVFSAQ
ncbi:MAG TPA: hypothetical protein VGJ57_06980 [Nitrospirales bacterium]|jgi:hypothetical protein